MDIHSVAEIFPLLTGDEFESLKADIATNGLREPVWTWQGKIIDGRNRARACEALGIEPATREWDGKGSLIGFVLSLNLHRRHLDASQRAMAAANALPYLEEEAKKRQSDGGKKAGRGRPAKKVPEFFPEPIPPAPANDESREEAARRFHTNPRYVSDAKRIKQEDPELAGKVARGELTIPKAKKQLPKKAPLQMRSRSRRRGRQTGRAPIRGAVKALLRLVEAEQISEQDAYTISKLPKDEQRRLVKDGASAVKARAVDMDWISSARIYMPSRFDPGKDVSDSARQEVLTYLEKIHGTLAGWITVLQEKLTRA
jgi:hypothetical protein